MNIHIKRMDLFAVLTLTNDAGKTFVTTLRRDILKTDPEVVEMVRRFRQDKKVIDKKPVAHMPTNSLSLHKQVYGRSVRQKTGVDGYKWEQGVLI